MTKLPTSDIGALKLGLVLFVLILSEKQISVGLSLFYWRTMLLSIKEVCLGNVSASLGNSTE